jgi:hypothetical protein
MSRARKGRGWRVFRQLIHAMQIRVPKVFEFETIAIIRPIQRCETNLALNNSPE